MKVRVTYTEEVDDDFRRAIRLHHGRDGLATRQEVKEHFWLYGQTMNDDFGMLLDDETE